MPSPHIAPERGCSLALLRESALCSLNRSYGYAFGRKPPSREAVRREQSAFRCNMRASE